MAVATGMVLIGSGLATSNESTVGDVTVDDVTGDDAFLPGWLEGLRLICTDLSGRHYPETLQWLVLLALEALLDDDPSEGLPQVLSGYALCSRVEGALRRQDTLRERVDERRLVTWLAPPYPGGGDWRLFGLLAEAGAVRGAASAPQVTALGRWAAVRLRALAPVQIAPEWPASTVLAHLAGAGEDADPCRLTVQWRWAREPQEAARELLAAATGSDVATRSAAVRLVTRYGETALPAWHDVLGDDTLGPHARLVLSWWEQGPGPRDGDRWWLGVERAAAALPVAGPDEALSHLAAAAGRSSGDRPGAPALVAALPGSGHPQAGQVAQALAEFLASGAPRSIEQLLQVKVRLAGWRPATWRRVLIPATGSLGTLSWVISVLFGWGFDHLHVFRVGRRAFTDPSFPLEEAGDEYDVRLSRLFATGDRTFAYTYDLGACWDHEIVLEKLVPVVGQSTLRCVAFAGDSPSEYPQVEDDDGQEIADPVLTRPFRLDRVNAILVSGHYAVHEWDHDTAEDETGLEQTGVDQVADGQTADEGKSW